MRTLFAFVAGLLWLIIAVTALVYAERIKRYRTDISPYDSAYSGRSPSLEGNVLNSANYAEAGKRKVRVLKALYAVQVVPAVSLLYLLLTG